MNGMNRIHEMRSMNGTRKDEKKLGNGLENRVFLRTSLALIFSTLYLPASLAQPETDHYGAQYPQNNSGYQNSGYENSNQPVDPGHEQAIQGFQKALEQHEAPVDPYAERSHEAQLGHGYKEARQGENSGHIDSYSQTDDRNRESPNGHEGTHTTSSQVHDPYRNSKPADYQEESGRSQHIPSNTETPVQNGEGYRY